MPSSKTVQTQRFHSSSAATGTDLLMFKFLKRQSAIPARPKRDAPKADSDLNTSSSDFAHSLDPLPVPEVRESNGPSGWSLWDDTLMVERLQQPDSPTSPDKPS